MSEESDVIVIPLPQDGDDGFEAAADLGVVVEDVSQGDGYFAVDYRRC